MAKRPLPSIKPPVSSTPAIPAGGLTPTAATPQDYLKSIDQTLKMNMMISQKILLSLSNQSKFVVNQAKTNKKNRDEFSKSTKSVYEMLTKRRHVPTIMDILGIVAAGGLSVGWGLSKTLVKGSVRGGIGLAKGAAELTKIGVEETGVGARRVGRGIKKTVGGAGDLLEGIMRSSVLDWMIERTVKASVKGSLMAYKGAKSGADFTKRQLKRKYKIKVRNPKTNRKKTMQLGGVDYLKAVGMNFAESIQTGYEKISKTGKRVFKKKKKKKPTPAVNRNYGNTIKGLGITTVLGAVQKIQGISDFFKTKDSLADVEKERETKKSKTDALLGKILTTLEHIEKGKETGKKAGNSILDFITSIPSLVMGFIPKIIPAITAAITSSGAIGTLLATIFGEGAIVAALASLGPLLVGGGLVLIVGEAIEAAKRVRAITKDAGDIIKETGRQKTQRNLSESNDMKEYNEGKINSDELLKRKREREITEANNDTVSKSIKGFADSFGYLMLPGQASAIRGIAGLLKTDTSKLQIDLAKRKANSKLDYDPNLDANYQKIENFRNNPNKSLDRLLKTNGTSTAKQTVEMLKSMGIANQKPTVIYIPAQPTTNIQNNNTTNKNLVPLVSRPTDWDARDATTLWK